MVRQLTSAAVAPLPAMPGPGRGPRRESAAERGQRQRERSRNLWRASLASLLLVVAVSTGVLAGANSGIVGALFSRPSQEALAAAQARRHDLRTGKVLFALPDGETCRPMHFDNLTGEMSPGAGTVPCYPPEQSRRTAADSGRFNWRSK